MFEACKAVTNTGDQEVCDRDAYYIGITLTHDADVTATITDGNGGVLDVLNLTVLVHGDSRSHDIPVPVIAVGGINVDVGDDDSVGWTVYYTELIGGLKHV